MKDTNVNRPIKMEDLQVGDEVIVRGVDLNYMQIVRPPVQKQVIDNWTKKPVMRFSSAVCNRINSKFGSKFSDDKQKVRFDFVWKSIWLVKREQELINK